MTSVIGTQTSNAWMIRRVGSHWAYLSEHHSRSFGKFFPPALLLEEIHRLGESEIPLIPLGILQFTVGVLHLIPKTSILGAILLTGFRW